MSFTKKPMKPMTRKPPPVAIAILENSAKNQLRHVIIGSHYNTTINISWQTRLPSRRPGAPEGDSPFLSGFAQRRTSILESLWRRHVSTKKEQTDARSTHACKPAPSRFSHDHQTRHSRPTRAVRDQLLLLTARRFVKTTSADGALLCSALVPFIGAGASGPASSHFALLCPGVCCAASQLIARRRCMQSAAGGRVAVPSGHSLVELERRVGDVLAECVVVRILRRHDRRGFEKQGLPVRAWPRSFLHAVASARECAHVNDIAIETPRKSSAARFALY
jgi:hypothetical protein